MNRRSFLKHSAVATAFSCLSPTILRAAATTNPAFDWGTLGSDIGYFKMSGGTIGWLITEDTFVVIDSQFPDNATQFLDRAKSVTSKEIDLLINTHHHSDHTKGNSVLMPHSQASVAHENCVKWQKLSSKTPEQEVVANQTFDDNWQWKSSDEIIDAKYYGNAHTSGDIVIHFQNRNVAHVGDLVFNHHPLYIDRQAGASIGHWIQVLEKLHGEYDNDTQFIFGHGLPHAGVTGNRSALLQMRDFLTELLAFTEKQIHAGATIEDIKSYAKLPGFEDYYTDTWTSAIPNALAVAYQELTETK